MSDKTDINSLIKVLETRFEDDENNQKRLKECVKLKKKDRYAFAKELADIVRENSDIDSKGKAGVFISENKDVILKTLLSLLLESSTNPEATINICKCLRKLFRNKQIRKEYARDGITQLVKSLKVLNGSTDAMVAIVTCLRNIFMTTSICSSYAGDIMPIMSNMLADQENNSIVLESVCKCITNIIANVEGRNTYASATIPKLMKILSLYSNNCTLSCAVCVCMWNFFRKNISQK